MAPGPGLDSAPGGVIVPRSVRPARAGCAGGGPCVLRLRARSSPVPQARARHRPGESMRTLRLLPLAIATVTVAGACRSASDDAEQTAFQVPRRDLTLQEATTSQVEVASPVELGRVPEQPRASRPHRTQKVAPQPAPAPAPSSTAAPKSAPAPATAASATTRVATDDAAAAPDPFALAPGQTVTVIPASSGPANEPSWTDRGPPDAPDGSSGGTTIHAGGHGGTCGGHGGGHHPGGGASPGFRGLQ